MARSHVLLEFGIGHDFTAVTESFLTLILTGQEARLRLALEAIKVLCHDSKIHPTRQGNHLYQSSFAQYRQNTDRGGERRVVLVNRPCHGAR